MKALAVALCLLFAATAASAATYTWTDKKGVVHYTDNFDRIPAQYQQRAREVSVEAPPPMKYEAPAVPEAAPAATPSRQGTGEIYCGRSGLAWQRQFESLRKERQQLADELPLKEKELQNKRRKYLARTARGDGYYAQKKEYREQAAQFKQAKARFEDLDKLLADLEAEAARCSLPLQFRQ